MPCRAVPCRVVLCFCWTWLGFAVHVFAVLTPVVSFSYSICWCVAWRGVAWRGVAWFCVACLHSVLLCFVLFCCTGYTWAHFCYVLLMSISVLYCAVLVLPEQILWVGRSEWHVQWATKANKHNHKHHPKPSDVVVYNLGQGLGVQPCGPKEGGGGTKNPVNHMVSHAVWSFSNASKLHERASWEYKFSIYCKFYEKNYVIACSSFKEFALKTIRGLRDAQCWRELHFLNETELTVCRCFTEIAGIVINREWRKRKLYYITKITMKLSHP